MSSAAVRAIQLTNSCAVFARDLYYNSLVTGENCVAGYVVPMRHIILILAAFLFSAPALAQDGTDKTFVQKRYKIEGTAKIVEQDGATHLVLSEDFKTKSGPDLKVYLTKKPIASLTSEDVATDSTKIGVLRSNKGAQTYILPTDLNLSDYESVVIHCEAFTVLWGGFDL